MSLSRPLTALLLILLLSGCGFRPLYAPPEEDAKSRHGIYALDAFRSVFVNNIADRDGQYLRNRLEMLLHPYGSDANVTHRLVVHVTSNKQELAVRKSAVATRALLEVSGSFSLMEEYPQSKEVYTGTVRASSGYNIFTSEFQTLIAQKGAKERALADIAEQLRILLAAYLTQPQSPAAAKGQ